MVARCTCERAAREARELALEEAARVAVRAIRAMQSDVVIVRGEARDAIEFDPKPKGARNPWA